MAKPLLLIMLGMPGAGKTTLARELAARHGFVLLTADIIRVAVIRDPQWNAAEHRYFFAMLNVLAAQLLAGGHSVIYDANHNQRRVRAQKYAEARQAGADVAVIHVTLGAADQAARTDARMEAGTTEVIPADKLKSSPAEIYKRVAASHEPPHQSEPVISVNGALPAEIQVAAIVASLGKQGFAVPAKPQGAPQLYLMLGLPGSGKTTAATELAKLTGAVHLSSDLYRLALFPKPAFTQEEHDVLYGTLDYLTELLLSQGIDVIYDANLNRRSHRQDKYDICAKTGAGFKLLWVQTSKSLAQSRRIADSHHLLRPPHESPEVMFERIASIFEEPEAQTEPYTILDGTKISAEYLRGTIGLP